MPEHIARVNVFAYLNLACLLSKLCFTDIANSIIGSDESWLTELDNDSFKQLIALNRQAII